MASDATKISKQSSYSSRMNLNSNSLSLFSQKQVNQFDHISVESKSSSGISSCVNQNQHYLGSAYRSCKQEKNYNLLIQSAFFKNTCREVTFLILLLTVVVFGIVVALLLLLLKNSLKRYRKLLIKDKTITIETRSTYKFEKMDNKFPHLTDGGHVHGIQRSYLTVDEKESSIEHEKPSTYYLKDIKRTSSADAIHNSSSFEKLHRQYRICDKKQFNLSVADTTSSSLTHPNSTLPSANELCYNDQFFSHEPHKYGAIKRYRESNVDPICKITFGQGSANSIQPSQNENLSKPEISEIFTLESSSIIRNTCLLQRKPFNDKNVENVRNELPASNDKKKKSAFDRDRRHINLSTNDENRSQVNDDCFRTVLSQSFIVFANEENSRNIHDISSNLTKNLAIASVKTALTPNVTNAFGVPREFILLPKPVQHDESSQLYRINDNSKIENSYFRFPEVDIFTPPIKEQVVNQNSIEKENEVEITSNIIMSISPEESSINPLALLPYPTIDVYDRSAKLVHNSYDRSTLTETKKDSNITTPTPSTNNAFFTNRVDRRSRLKSISLDSEGARLVEENFTKSIPVEELVEIVANQSHSSQNESQVQLKILGTRDDNDQVLGKKRNIFNLTLDLNDRDDTLITDNDCKLNEFYVEYYDYDDDDEDDNDNDDEIEKYDGQSQTTTKVYTDRRIKQHFELQTSKIPPLKHTRQKACSLDSARSVSYVQPQDITYKFPDKEEHKTARALNSRTSLTRTFSLSVPTTPKRQFYRLHQHSGKFKSNLFNNDDGSLNINNSPAAEKYLFCGFQQQIKSSEEIFDVFSNSVDIGHKTSSTKTLSSDISQRREQDLSNVNLKTLPEICPVRSFADSNTLEKPYLQALSKSRSSILQRRGSNHSLTLNLDIIAVSDNLSKRLSASNYSLGNYKGSRLSLVGSSFNLQQQPQQMHGSNLSSVQTSQSKKNLLQRRGSNTSLILNLKGSSSSLNHYTSQGSLNIQNQQNFRPAKKGLLERRNSNSNLALFNVQNRELSKSNSNLPGSICSLNSISTYHSKNGQLMLEATEHHENINCEHWSLANTLNESHLTPKCQQYGGRRKFLSTDGLNDITDSRAGYCCQQRETNANNLQIFHKEPTDNCCGSAENVKKHYAFHKIDCACMAGKATVSDKVNVPCKNNFKFKSTVVSTASANNLTQFTCCNYCCCSCVDSLVEAVNTMSISNTNVRKITTKPLSPQTTSEDFKIYLANIQFLQNASNLLSENYIQNLHCIFEKSYYRSDKTRNGNASLEVKSNHCLARNAQNQEADNSTGCIVSEPVDDHGHELADEEQRKMILKIHQEFWDLPTNHQEKPMVFGSQPKNRYRTILPNENTRFILAAESGMTSEPYINANLIKGPDYTNNKYIATQGPMNNTIYEFWLMVHQNIMNTAKQHCLKGLEVEQKIVMLTDLVENNRQKCAIYFPLQCNESLLFSRGTTCDTEHPSSSYVSIVEETLANLETTVFKPTIFENYFIITNLGICRKNGYTMRKLLVIYGAQQKSEMTEHRNIFMVYHYWFPDWPDHRSPDDIDVLLDMSLDILDRDCSKDFSNVTNITSNRICTLPVIHCSAGIGRTGCLLAILNGLSQMRHSFNSSKTDHENSNNCLEENSMLFTSTVEDEQHLPPIWKKSRQVCVDILGIVCNLRLQRGGMVQNSEQYELIHRALCLYLQKLCV